MSEKHYKLTYEYQTCFDDGGVGHDMWWVKTESTFTAKTDKEAREIAKEKLKSSSPCNGSWCSNKGLKRWPNLERVTTVVVGDANNLLITTITQKKLKL